MIAQSPTEKPARTEQFVSWLIHWRWPLLALGVALAAVAYQTSRHLQFDRSVENMFASDDPLLKPYRLQQRAFGGNEVVLAAYVDPQLMTAAGMQRLEDLCGQLSACRESTPCSAWAAARSGRTSSATIRWPSRCSSFMKVTPWEPTAKRRPWCACWRRQRVSRGQTIDAIRQILEAAAPGGVVVGVPVMVVDGFRYLERDGLLLGIVSVLLLVRVIVFCFRSLRWVLIPLAVTQWTLIATKAALVASQLPLTLVSSMLGANITIIGVATTVHIIVRYRELRDEGWRPKPPCGEPRPNWPPRSFGPARPTRSALVRCCSPHVGPVHDFGLMMVIGSFLVIAQHAAAGAGPGAGRPPHGDPRRAWGEHHLDASLRRISSFARTQAKGLGLGQRRRLHRRSVRLLAAGSRNRFHEQFPLRQPAGPLVSVCRIPAGRCRRLGLPGPHRRHRSMGSKLDRLRHLEARLRDEVRVHDAQGRDAPGLTKVMSIVDALDAATLDRLRQVPIAARARSADCRRLVAGRSRSADSVSLPGRRRSRPARQAVRAHHAPLAGAATGRSEAGR